MFYLGRLFEWGLGVEKTRDAAISWYREAAASETPYADQPLKRLGVAAQRSHMPQ